MIFALFIAFTALAFIIGAIGAVSLYEEKIKNGKPMEFDGVVYVAKPVKIEEADDGEH